MDLTTCKKNGLIRSTRVDKNLISSLIEMSKIKENIVKDTTLNTININGFFPMAYDSLRELMEAYSVLHGQKVGNHECLGKLVNHLSPQFDMFTFERLRIARNGVNYYGIKVDFEQGQELILKIWGLNESMRTLLSQS